MPDTPATRPLLTIGEVSARAGVSVPTVRYYEELGILRAQRSPGNQRLFPRHVLRRLALVAAGRRVGVPLARLREMLDRLPSATAPTSADWTRLSEEWAAELDRRMAELQALREDLDGCIGCGCLSLTRCALFNPGDNAAGEGAGSRWLRRAKPHEEPTREDSVTRR